MKKTYKNLSAETQRLVRDILGKYFDQDRSTRKTDKELKKYAEDRILRAADEAFDRGEVTDRGEGSSD